MGIKLVQSKLDRAFADDAGEVWLLLKHRATDAETVEAVAYATSTWAEPFITSGEDVGDCRLANRIEGGTALLFTTAGLDGSMRWIFKFITELDDRDITGTLTTLDGAKPPELASAIVGVDWPTANLFWTFDPTTAIDSPGRAYVDGRESEPRATTRSLKPLTRWVLEHPQGVGSIYTNALPSWSQLPATTSVDQVANAVDRLVRREAIVDLLAIDPAGNTSCSASWRTETSHTYLQVMAPAPMPLWTTKTIDRLRQALIDNATDLSLGFIETGTLGRKGILPGNLTPDNVAVSHAYLLDQYVPDACAIQVLTEHHLKRIRHLDRWNVSELTPDRYLVEAPDLEPWFRDEQHADWDTHQQARTDFADILITPDALNNNPPPWGRRAPVEPWPYTRPTPPRTSYRPRLT